MPQLDLPPMHWGSMPELVGPRHAYRVRRLVDLLAERLPHGRVLDAGCGSGTATLMLARLGYRVVAVDASAEFVDHLRDRLRRDGLEGRVEVRTVDLAMADLRPGGFDGAICGEVLEHLPDDRRALETVSRALRPGGVLALSVPAGPERFDWLDRWAGHERRYDEERLRAILAAARLDPEVLVRWGFPFMLLYERFVQRPGLAAAARNGADHPVAQLARARPVVAAWGALFALDRLAEGRVPRGTGFLVRAQRR
ncbi:MAG TPA: methyltransferase domain-containing protein [bacterium]|nr:methyltransferase domain-containing protein [bacterium]